MPHLNSSPRRSCLRVLAAACVLPPTVTLTFAAANAAVAAHGFPAEFGPVVVPAQALDGNQHLFDLRPAQARARALGKRMYVYLGAEGCGFCQRYEKFLHDHAAALKDAFAKDYLIVDLRSTLDWLSDKLVIQTEKLRLPYPEFQAAIGDERGRRLVYPNIWIMDADTKPLIQAPVGAGTFSSVEEQLALLRLDF